ncbi:MAG: dihydropteroate synthase-like protein, partial [Candidatus Thorarchaeota archaeon]
MKVLLITGTLAEPIIRQILEDTSAPHDFDLMVMPLAVAAFLHPKYVAAQIKLRGPLDQYNLILLPGMVSGDTSLVTTSTGIPTFKGTRHAADLPFVLENLFEAKAKLSTTHPADVVLAEELAVKAKRDLLKGMKRPEEKLREGMLEVGKGTNSFIIGRRLPLRIVAEITDAPLRTEEELIRLATHFVNSGANIVDIGMVAEAPDQAAAKSIVKMLRKHIQVPISIDSANASEIVGGIEGGAHLVLSLDQDNMMDIPNKFRKKAAFTVIPATQEGAELPKTQEDRIRLLEENLSNARSLGFKKLIADPLCDPLITPGLSQAILAYAEFHKRQPHVPLLMGTGNITELLDADSPGVNAVLAGLAAELGISLLLTTEVSPKTRGAVWELH